jgi:ABC-2 type transport system permease protein
MNWRSVSAILRKDLRDAIVSLRIVAMLIMPLSMTGLYGFVFRDAVPSLRIVVYDPAESLTTVVLKNIPGMEVVTAPDAASVEPLTNERGAQLGLIFPPDFDQALKAEANPPLTLIVNRAQLGADGVAQSVLTAIQLQTPRSIGVDLTRREINDAPQNTGLLSRSFGFKGVFAVMSMVLLLATLGVFMVPATIIEEKEFKTLDALMVGPVSHVDLIAAKAAAGLMYALLMDGIVLAVNQAFVEANLAVLAAVLGLGSLAVVMLGLLMGSLFNSMQSLSVWSSFVMIPFLGPVVMGFLPNAPLQNVLPLLPTYHLVQGLRLALEPNADVGALGGHLLVLALTTLALGAGVLWLLRRREA